MILDSYRHLAGLFEAGLTNAVSELKPERAFIAYRGRGSEEPQAYATHGFSMAGLFVDEDISTTVVNQTLKEGKSQLIVDAISAPGLNNQNSVILSGLRSVLVVPLRLSNGLTVGVLYIDNRLMAGAFQAPHEAFLTSIAQQLVDHLGPTESRMKSQPKDVVGGIPFSEIQPKALLLLESGSYTEALSLVEQWIYGRTPSEELGLAQGVRGRILQQMGQLDSALEAVAIAVYLLGQSAGNSDSYALMLNNLAGLHVGFGHHYRAQGLLIASSSHWSRLIGNDKRHKAGLSATLYNLGKLNLEMNQAAEAKKWFERAYVQCQEFFGQDHPRTLKIQEALTNLG